MKNSIPNNKNFRFIRLLTIVFNDLLILNASISVSYYLRIEYFINSFEVIKVHIVSSIIYIILFFIYGIPKQFFNNEEENHLGTLCYDGDDKGKEYCNQLGKPDSGFECTYDFNLCNPSYLNYELK